MSGEPPPKEIISLSARASSSIITSSHWVTMLDGGSTVSASDIVITNGCHGALSIALLSVCKPGDIVAVESPSFHGTMQ